MEEAILEKLSAVAAGDQAQAPDYLQGLRAAVTEAVAFGLNCVRSADYVDQPVPIPVLAQARRAARSDVGLDTVLRRYAAGERILTTLLVAEGSRSPAIVVSQVRRDLDKAIDRLMGEVSSEYQLEMGRIGETTRDRGGERIRILFESDSPNGTLSGYDLAAWHIGLVSEEEPAEPLIRRLGEQMKRQTLVSVGGQGQTWIWFGGQVPPSPLDVMEAITDSSLGASAVSVGEARFGLAGWRQTLREARLGLEYPGKSDQKVLRARDVLLTVAVLKNPVVARALLDTYADAFEEATPVKSELHRTLRAYLASGQNATTAAAMLRVDRRTVERRLRAFEKTIGRTVEECHSELPLALELDEMGARDWMGISQEVAF